MQNKQCGKCKYTKSVTEFFKYHKHNYQHWCKQCMREYQRKYNKTPKKRAYDKKYYEQYKKTGYFKKYSQRPEIKKRKAAQMRTYHKDPVLRLRHNVRRKIGHLVDSGDITKPKNCSKCNSEKCIQAHHSDYNKPREVVWLCRICHIEITNKARAS